MKCPNCGGSYKIDKLRVHLKYFCGESAQRTEAQSRQRRTVDRPQSNHQRPHNAFDRGGGGGNGKKKKKLTKNTDDDLQCLPCSDESVQKGKKKGSKTVRVQRSAAYDSDSELSVPDDLELSAKRPSRSAANNAKKRLSDSARQTVDSDESSDGDSDAFQAASSSSESESEESVAPVKTTKRKMVATPAESDDSRSDSEEDDAIASARSKQAAAMRRAKATSKATSKKGGKGAKGGKRKLDEKAKKKGKSKKPRGKMTKGKKKKFNDSSDSSSDNSSDEEADDDPLAGIDVDALMEAAMAGAKPSVLHTMSWWRVVLDEAHFIKSRSR